MPVGEGGRITKEIGTSVVSVSDYDTDGIVALRITVLALLLVAWSPALHAEQPSPDQPRLRSALPWLDLKSMSSTRDRPLFAQDRRKLRPPVAPAARAQGTSAQEQKRPQMTLMGIIEVRMKRLFCSRMGRHPISSRFAPETASAYGASLPIPTIKRD